MQFLTLTGLGLKRSRERECCSNLPKALNHGALWLGKIHDLFPCVSILWIGRLCSPSACNNEALSQGSLHMTCSVVSRSVGQGSHLDLVFVSTVDCRRHLWSKPLVLATVLLSFLGLCSPFCQMGLSRMQKKPAGVKGVKVKTKFARLDSFARGMSIGASLAGMPRKDIRTLVTKTDQSKPTLRAIDGVLATYRADPSWRGQDSKAGGRPPALTAAEKMQLKKLVFAERAKAKVTVPYCQKRLPFLRLVSEETVRQALLACGLAWLVRRAKRRIYGPDKKQRVTYSNWVKRQPQEELDEWAYTDGTTWYLARTMNELTDKETLGLGKFVWRMANGKDGLWEENVGPSCYAKSQGLPVKIWGLFGNGRLEYFVLPKDGTNKTTNMNGARYNKLVKTHFAKWRRSCFGRKARVFLVKDQ